MPAAMPLDDAISTALLEQIAQRGGTRHYPAHAVLINEGDTTDALFLIVSGRVKAYATSEDGRDVVLGEQGPGEYFGELALDGGQRSVSVMTLEPCTCCVVPGPRLREFLAEHPDFAWHLALKFARMVRRLTDQVKSLALQDVYGRLVRLLMEMSEATGAERIVRQKLTQQDIAERIGSSREMVNRVMKELTIGGYVSVRDGRHVIHRKLPSAW